MTLTSDSSAADIVAPSGSPRVDPARKRGWDWNLRACSRQGHVHYLPEEAWAAEGLTAATPDGGLTRCLRCGGFYPAENVPTGPLALAPVVERDKALRERFILRLLAVERGVRGLFVLLISIGAFGFFNSQQQLRLKFEQTLPLFRPVAEELGYDIDHLTAVTLVRDVLTARSNSVLLIAYGLVAYGLIQVGEAVGLWLAKRWGEYLSAVATSAFLPLEVYEVMEKNSLFKAGALVVNIAAVAWLIYTKRLFGLRGGHAALIESHRGESLLPAGPQPE